MYDIDIPHVSSYFHFIPLGIGGKSKSQHWFNIPMYSNQVTLRQLDHFGTRIHLQGFAPTSSGFHLETTGVARTPWNTIVNESDLETIGILAGSWASWSHVFHVFPCFPMFFEPLQSHNRDCHSTLPTLWLASTGFARCPGSGFPGETWPSETRRPLASCKNTTSPLNPSSNQAIQDVQAIMSYKILEAWLKLKSQEFKM